MRWVPERSTSNSSKEQVAFISEFAKIGDGPFESGWGDGRVTNETALDEQKVVRKAALVDESMVKHGIDIANISRMSALNLCECPAVGGVIEKLDDTMVDDELASLRFCLTHYGLLRRMRVVKVCWTGAMMLE